MSSSSEPPLPLAEQILEKTQKARALLVNEVVKKIDAGKIKLYTSEPAMEVRMPRCCKGWGTLTPFAKLIIASADTPLDVVNRLVKDLQEHYGEKISVSMRIETDMTVVFKFTCIS